LPPIAAASEPDTEDRAAWRTHIDARDREVAALMSANAKSHPSDVTAHDLSRSRLYELKPANFSPRHEKRAILYIHGGALNRETVCRER
jgi:dipeptidyl aminopeptidase/acylaminoacyl peptidase